MSRPSLRKSINAYCKECIYDPVVAGTWRQQVEGCEMTDCPFYEIRALPLKKARKGQIPLVQLPTL